ncbi:MAG: FAD-binding domain [Deltaproteobacteria bacterium]
MRGASVLISGIGIAGPALAFWLSWHGFVPTLVERANELRTDGYIIDFWGLGYEIADKMGLLPEVLRAGYHVKEVRLVDRSGRRVGGFDADIFRRSTHGRYTSLPRGDLSAILYASVERQVEAIFGNSVRALDEDEDGVLVHFEHGPSRRFDLVVGADGLHSNIRRLAFGDEWQFERFLGYTVAAFESSGYRPREEGVYLAFGVPGLQIARFSMRDDRTMFLIVLAEEAAANVSAHDLDAQKRYLARRCAGLGWECDAVLQALDHCDQLYFDRVSQIRMDRWWKGRVALVGDAAAAPSLLAGEGSALALISAYVLAGELARTPQRLESGLVRYEQLLQRFLRQKQDSAAGFAGSFAPRTRFGVFLRNQVTKAFALPFLGQLLLGSTLKDGIHLPSYRVN